MGGGCLPLDTLAQSTETKYAEGIQEIGVTDAARQKAIIFAVRKARNAPRQINSNNKKGFVYHQVLGLQEYSQFNTRTYSYCIPGTLT